MDKFEKIASFTVDHNNLYSGLYLSRKDEFNGAVCSTFDIRMTSPNREQPMDGAAMHTLEHLGATYLRNSSISQQVVYFGPMGCKTGFYLVVFGNVSSVQILPVIKQTFDFIANFEGDIPGATPSECGNYSYQNLELAKRYAKKYLHDLEKYCRTEY